MANVTTEQILIDGYRNAVVKALGVLDTANVSARAIVDPADFAPVPTRFRIDRINYSVSDQLTVQLLWDATTDVVAVVLAGRGCIEARDFGGIIPNPGAGATGIIRLTTTGWASGTQTYNIILEMVKLES